MKLFGGFDLSLFLALCLCLRLCKYVLWWSAYSVASNTLVMLPNAGSWTKTDESKLKDVFSLNEMIHGVLGTLFTPFFIQFTSLLTLNLEKPNYWIQWIVSNTIKYTNLFISLCLPCSLCFPMNNNLAYSNWMWTVEWEWYKICTWLNRFNAQRSMLNVSDFTWLNYFANMFSF